MKIIESKKYDCSWYRGKEFFTVLASSANEADELENIIKKNRLSYDYRGVTDSGEHIYIIFKIS